MEESEVQSESTRREQLDRHVQEFLREIESGDAVDLEAFCARAPKALQSELRGRCADLLILKRVLPSSVAAQLPPNPHPGHELGPFKLLSEVGRGAMGVVYLARQISEQRLVAVKVLFPHLLHSQRHLERFRREAKSAARLQHPGIVPVQSVGEDRGLAFFAMDYVDGRSLHAELEALRARRAEGHAPTAQDRLGHDPHKSYPAEVAEIVAGIAEALHYAHVEGVIHRDVKPQNILIGPGGRPMLVDFGLAKDLDQESLTKSGDIAGTPYYMSPEQALARRVAIDHRTDVFSLGVVMYEMLTLRRPFEGQTSQQILYKISFHEPEPIRKVASGVPRDLETICIKAMQKKPEHRYASAGEMAADLKRFLAYESILAKPPSPLQIAARHVARHRAAVVAGVVTALAALIGFHLHDSLARDRDLARELATLQGTDLEDLVQSGNIEELRRLLESAQRLRSLTVNAGLVSAGSEVADGIVQRIQEFARQKREQGFTALERIRSEVGLARQKDSVVDWLPCADSLRTETEDALADLRQAAPLLPDDVELQREVRAGSRPRITVHCETNGARVSLREIRPDGSVGPLVPVGRTPLDRVAVRFGFYRVVVEDDAGRYAEMTRILQRPMYEYVLDARLRDVAEVTQGMQRIEPAHLKCQHPGLEDPTKLVERSVDEPFWIDLCEVTNAQYREFVLATGHPEPLMWSDGGGYQSAWDHLPVTTLRWSDAIEYAEWAGKRLPTPFEWQLAARGSDGREFPWGDQREQVATLASLGHRELQHNTPELYLRHIEKVDSRPEARSPFGLFHTFDNLSEWTEGLEVRDSDGRLSFVLGRPVSFGCSYKDEPVRAHLGVHWDCDVENTTYYTGLRCAKSASR